MKVLLVKDVPGLGRAGELKEVADGYGRNYLLPRGLAVLARPGDIKQAEERRRAEDRRHQRELADAQELARELEQLTLIFRAKAGEGTKLYGSITTADIAQQLEERLGREFDRRKILLEEPIRQLGEHKVAVKLPGDLTPQVTVVVEREEESGE